jgi:phosphoribosylglycinamide formyltransferase-1
VNINSDKKVSILIFASGNGSNAENLITYFKNKHIEINWIVATNNSEAGVIERCVKLNVPYFVISKNELYKNSLVKKIKLIDPSLIILAGFLLKIPEKIIDYFPQKIINIHPSLLPKYGGKGMYGMNVHKKIIENKESKSGISIHYVNKDYDEGEIITQKTIEIIYPTNALNLSKEIHRLEMKYFPITIEKLLNNFNNE